MRFYGIERDRSKLKENGIPGKIAVFSEEVELEKWVLESWRRSRISKDQIQKYIGYRKAFNEFAKKRLDKDKVEPHPMDEIYFQRINNNSGRDFKYMNLNELVKAKRIMKGK